MTIQLTAAQSRALNQLLKGGRYATVQDVVAQGLTMLRRKETDEARAVSAGMRQVKARRVSLFDEAALERIKVKGRRMLAAERRSAESLA